VRARQDGAGADEDAGAPDSAAPGRADAHAAGLRAATRARSSGLERGSSLRSQADAPEGGDGARVGGAAAGGRMGLSFFSSRTELCESFNRGQNEGKQVLQYFNFLNVIQVNNVIMCACALASWLPHAANVMSRMADEGVASHMGLGRAGMADVLFLSSYQPSSDGLLDLTLLLGTAVMFATAPVYYLLAKRVLRDEQADDDGDARTVDEADRTPHYDPHYQDSGGEPPRRVLRAVSYGLFVAVCAVPAGVDYGLAFDLSHRKLKPLYEKFAGQYPLGLASHTGEGLDMSESPLVITLIVVSVKAVFDLIFEVPFVLHQHQHQHQQSPRPLLYSSLCQLELHPLQSVFSLPPSSLTPCVAWYMPGMSPRPAPHRFHRVAQCWPADAASTLACDGSTECWPGVCCRLALHYRTRVVTVRSNRRGTLSTNNLQDIAIIQGSLSTCGQVVAAVLTDLERHASYSAHRLHRLLKLLVFRVCNTQSLFLVRYFADVPFYPCLAARAGNQAFIMILLDLTLSNFAEIGFSAAFNAAHRWKLRRAAAAKGQGAEPGPSPAAKAGTAPARATSLRANRKRLGGGSEAKVEQGGGEGKGGGDYGENESDDGDGDEVDDGNAESEGGDGNLKGGEKEEEGEAVAEIELTDDYLELLYRQYVMLACLGAFPLVTVAPPHDSVSCKHSVALLAWPAWTAWRAVRSSLSARGFDRGAADPSTASGSAGDNESVIKSLPACRDCSAIIVKP
jgi:hypothetical protein